MKIYKVGGCIRDQIMGIEAKDIDYVVVGANTQDINHFLEQGYERVGNDFPVFLHPITKCEYALARIERKIGTGYNGFDFQVDNVTLEEDLLRRDLTINAMAQDEQGNIIDPYGGKNDIKNRILRHVSQSFKEDPVRILRIARFSARYDFQIAPETISFMKEMVDNGEFDSLTPERVWKEFEKVLSEPHLQNFFESLSSIGALRKIPGFTSIKEKDFFDFIRSHIKNQDEIFNFSLMHVFSQMNKTDLKKWKMPQELQQKVNYFSIWKSKPGFYSYMDNEEKINFIQQTKAIHNKNNAMELIKVIDLYHSWQHKCKINFKEQTSIFINDVELVKNIDYENIVKQALLNKEKPNEVVKSIQLKCLDNNNYKKKLKL